MTSAAETTPTRSTSKKQKHVTTACVNCRTRKIKCDAGTPRCSNCILYTQQCVYQQGLDKRKIPIKERLLAMTTYARQLEALLTANGIPLPQEKDQIPGSPSEPPPSSTVPITSPSPEKQEILLSESDLQPALTSTSPTNLRSPSAQGASPLVGQLAGNFGSLQIAEDGQLRFYGATSNLHLLVKGARKSNAASKLSTPFQVQNTLNAAGVGHFVETELEDHLIKLYFCWEDPSIHLVQEDVFYRERRKCKSGSGPSKYYSEVLVNAMCAVGASLTSRHCFHLPEPMVDFFSSRARALMDVELDSPTLSTVQSLGILSGVEAIRTLDARGWIYSGIAVRLATDLGLHLDTQAYVDAGILDVEEAAVRKATFWGTFIHDRMWSLYLGRPASLNDSTITTPEYVCSATVQKYWQPYVDESEDFSFPALLDPLGDLHRQNATLCAKMTRIRETLYSDSIISALAAQQLHDFASDMRSELLQWHTNLPDSLQVDLSSMSTFYVPHVLQLHMQYHCVMILVNRPFFSANIATFPDVAFSDPMVGRPACTESARKVSKLLHIYRRLYSFRRINIQAVHIIFTTSLIHVLNACDSTDPSLMNSAWNDLEVCCQALEETAKGYKNAARAIEVVNGIKNELLKTTRESAKRSIMSAPTLEHDQGDSKRRRHSAWEDDAATLTDDAAADQDNIEEDTVLNPSMNAIDSIFWSELTSLEFNNF